MNYLPDERMVLESNSLTLTTHRVRFAAQAVGSGTIKSIMLEELASCALIARSQPGFLIAAAIFFALGVIAGRSETLILGTVVALVCVAVYFATRKQTLMIASAGTTIYYNTQGMNRADIEKFIDRTEEAKNDRYLLLRRP